MDLRRSPNSDRDTNGHDHGGGDDRCHGHDRNRARDVHDRNRDHAVDRDPAADDPAVDRDPVADDPAVDRDPADDPAVDRDRDRDLQRRSLPETTKHLLPRR